MNLEPGTLNSRLVIGVDGGGTKTLVWLAPLDDATNTIVLGRGQAGPGNPRAAGFESAQNNIAAAIDAAFADAKLPRMPAAAACFGLAGAGREVEQQSISQWALDRKIAHQVRVCGDAEPILAAASPDHRGIALICGTGSLAWGRDIRGKIARSGGWGFLVGDEGGGYMIARAGMIAALRAADGRGQATELLDQFLKALCAATPEQLIERIYAPEMTRDKLAGFCHVVFGAAPSDAVARTLVAEAAQQLAQMVAAVAHRLELSSGEFPLALAGSVILNQPLLRQHLQEHLETMHSQPSAVWLVPEPVRGAIALARLLARTN